VTYQYDNLLGHSKCEVKIKGNFKDRRIHGKASIIILPEAENGRQDVFEG
jgi:hypothetical protein